MEGRAGRLKARARQINFSEGQRIRGGAVRTGLGKSASSLQP
jgi:hypothetical protein